MPLVAGEDLQGEFEGNGCLCTPKCVDLTIRPACGGGLCIEWMGIPFYACNCGSFYCLCSHQTLPFITPDKDHGDLISELLQITAELGGQMERSDCADSSGLYWKKIVITYDVHEKKK